MQEENRNIRDTKEEEKRERKKEIEKDKTQKERDSNGESLSQHLYPPYNLHVSLLYTVDIY